MNQPSIKPLDEKQLLERNKSVDKKIVDRHQNLEQELRRLGVETKPRFTIAPPLGGSRLMLFNGR